MLSSRKLGDTRLRLCEASEKTTITTSICQQVFRGGYGHISDISDEQQNEENEDTKTFPSNDKTIWIIRENIAKIRSRRKVAFLQQSKFHFIARNKKKQRFILTEELGYRRNCQNPAQTLVQGPSRSWSLDTKFTKSYY